MSEPFVEKRPWGGWAIVTLAYVVALVVATAVVKVLPVDWHPLLKAAVADAAATVAVFLFSVANDNTSVYDPYWSVAPVVIAMWLAFGPGDARDLDLRQLSVLTLVTLYGVRLTTNWARGWRGVHHEDWRYVAYRTKTGKLYWVVSFTGLHFFPTVLVMLGCLPLHAALVEQGASFGVVDVLAAIVTLLAIAVETIADEQLRAFRQDKRNDGDVCNVGLWSWSRHPNYFGEISFWVGLWLFGVAAGAPWWTAAGWASMVALFVGVSIPLAEERSLMRRPQFVDYQRRVSMLIPLPPRATATSSDP
jgi:steroid 5-alpha reductase family enzyme